MSALTEAEIDALEPTYIGPTWKCDPLGKWLLPERTLGWEIAGWCAKYMLAEDGGPWKFTKEQLRFVLWWYAVDHTGRFVYRKGVFQRLKGHGKDPLLAVLCLVELVGPSRFSHWDEKGKPVGEPHPQAWVQVTATNQAQTSNTMSLIPSLVSDLMRETYDIQDGAVLIRAMRGRVRLEAVTSSYRSLEGKRTTFTLLNEALAIDTPVPTPSGWTTMGELRDGSIIYGSDGQPTIVTKAHDVQVGRDCYRVTLANGASVVASDGHPWLTVPKGPLTKPRVRTTREMVEDGRRFRVPRPGAQASPAIALPLDPYILGAWLGDGSTGGCNITIGRADEREMVRQFALRGVELNPLACDESRPARRFGFSVRSGGFGAAMGTATAKALRKLECYRSKHIPEQYMSAGTEQRKELLRGLMDTDGCYSNQGIAIFVGRKRLSRDVFRLASSLGLLPNIAFAPDPRSREGGSWRVSFLPEGFNPFSMARKAGAVEVQDRRAWVSIKAITPVDSVPVRCISVDAPDRLFQAGDGVVTHNTHHFVSGNNGHKMYEVIDGNATKKDSRYLAITNAYLPGEDSVAERMREAYEKIEDGKAVDVGFLYDSVEAHEKTPLTPEALMIVLPKIRGDSIWLRPETIIQSILDTTLSASRSRRMWLNQVVAEEDALYTKGDWDPNANPSLALKAGDEVVLGFDGGKTDDATALVALRISDQAAFLIGLWEKPDGPKGEGWIVPRELVDQAVRSAHEVFEVQGFYGDVALWESYISEWSDDFRETYAVKSTAGDGISYDMRSSLQRITRAHERLVQAILDGKVKHTGDRDFRRHVLNARRRTNAWGLSFGKESKDSPKKVDAYAALLLAFECLHDLRTRGKKVRKRTGQGFFL